MITRLIFIFLVFFNGFFASWAEESEIPLVRTGPALLPWDKTALKETAAEARLELIFKSIENHFPLTEITEKQIEIAEGREMSSQGAFDFRLQMQAGVLTETYDQQVLDGVLTKQIPGTPLELYGGWRRGKGIFRPYEGKLLTGAEGEYRGGLKIPLLRDLLYDSSRTRAMTSKLLLGSERENAKFRVLELKRIASDRYWEWIGAYYKLDAALKLYRLADERLSQVKKRVKAGSSARIEIVEVERMIAQRKTQLIEAERSYQKCALDLSFYYRDKDGNPQNALSVSKNFDFHLSLSDDSWSKEDSESALKEALSMRGDLKALEKQSEAAEAEMRLSKSQILPKLDAQFEYAVDQGAPKAGEKELRGMLTLTFPFENRESRGNLMAAQARMDQVRLSKSFLNDQIKQDMLNLRSALVASQNKAKTMLLDRDLSERLAQAERKRFQDGLSTLMFVNLREQTANDSAIKAMDAIVEYQKIKILYQVSKGLEPI